MRAPAFRAGLAAAATDRLDVGCYPAKPLSRPEDSTSGSKASKEILVPRTTDYKHHGKTTLFAALDARTRG